ncbi:MAG: endonuclease/exonuclease/phosphatase family protein [Bacteroidota bacterium]
MIILRIVIYIITVAHLISIGLALIKKDFWVFRIFDYPRMQKFVILASVMIVFFIFFRNDFIWIDWLLMCLVFISLVYLAYLILPFTIVGKKMISENKDPLLKKLQIVVANVYQENKDHKKLLQLIELRKPDVLLLVETDHNWQKSLQILKQTYPYYIEVPKDNTYGMLFYSRFKILHHQIKYLVDPEIPSIEADIEFDDQTIKLFALHPTPPSPTENLYSTDRDAEILMVAKKAKHIKGPCMVIGDLNDVAWSYTTELFLKTSGLLDPRRGRGWYNTYNAKYVVFRWPLDHLFVSGHFRLVDIKVEKHIGSDHFPISMSVVLSEKDDSGKLKLTLNDEETANEKIAQPD